MRCARAAARPAFAIRRSILDGGSTTWSGVAMLPTFRFTPITTGSVTGYRPPGTSHDTVMRHFPSAVWKSRAVLGR